MADGSPHPAAPQDGEKRCFICLMDENESGSSESAWVNPCPCTLEGHQDCMIQWVMELEREGKEIQCPVCKATINIDEPYDPALALNNQIYKAFSKVSPGLILGGLGAGTWVGLAMYGNIAVRVFAGPEATYRFFFNDSNPRGVPMVNWIHVAILPTIAPALILGQSFPVLGNVFFMPAAALYGVFHMARDDHFFSWPPSPQLAATCFPYIRAVYNNLYHEFVCPYERRWERRIAGLPEPVAPPVNNRPNENRQRRARNNDGANNDGGRNVGIVGGLLDAAIDMLDIPDVAMEVEVEEAELGEEQGIAHLEILVEELEEDAAERENAVRQVADAVADAEPHLNVQPHQQGNDQPPIAQQPAQPAAAAPRQRGIQASLRDVTNALASTLLLPVLSAGMGELLRLVLPKHWTTPMGGFGRFRVRTGLLQDQWGRNLVGGCIYIVLRDAFRLYAKYRMAQNKPLRKIRNVDRRRNQSSSSS
ncbi:RING finger domain-containing protein [Colletotrichum tofieldiae]|uniref:RING finger domain-containing protein n=1 Tax=Colletotrichum tofieldiae TaxID=708197 RepID=A0A166U7E6_9PEZI|nr:RING finger domain-containing protein [Colletotrichum tofieldiae]GKT63327.1 RING finger domain-containing protein [Colletotrichum tofieldiae]GKT72662.1 RING finger domain-containing protein [Colletotrichum tofieldiae]GKT89497.1 RING finger domain-containing protein [Colletotrichum tofieldiae]